MVTHNFSGGRLHIKTLIVGSTEVWRYGQPNMLGVILQATTSHCKYHEGKYYMYMVIKTCSKRSATSCLVKKTKEGEARHPAQGSNVPA
jgi:hypothetical protein